MLNQLNTEQLRAVMAFNPRVLVLAGAGSGKTRCLTYRIGHLIKNANVSPEEIMAVTFTNKAADEMVRRINQMNIPTNGIWIGTFHSLCNRILRKYASQLGFDHNFTIYDTDDTKNIIRNIMKSYGMSTSPLDVNIVASKISDWKTQLLTPGHVYNSWSADPKKHHQDHVRIYIDYSKELVKNHAMDFDDLIIRVIQLMDTSAGARAWLHGKFKHIMVDEYQDINHAQYVLIQKFLSPVAHLWVCGDPDQCLPEGTLVNTENGPRPIETIKVGERVYAGQGDGKIVLSEVTDVIKSTHRELVTIKTTSGKTLRSSYNHIWFVALGDMDDSWYTYLMWRHDKGFRIGSTQANGKNYKTSLLARANQEKADRMWLLTQHETRAEAEYTEQRFALKYQIPMTPFVPRNGMYIRDEFHKQIFSEFGYNGYKLLEDLGFRFSHPHYISQGTMVPNGDMCKVNVNLLMAGTRGSQVNIETSNKFAIEIIKNLGYKMTTARVGKRLRISSRDYAKVDKIAHDIVSALKQNKIRCDLVYKAGFTGDRTMYYMVPAVGIHKGMYIPVLDNGRVIIDTVSEVIRETDYRGVTCYDLNVDTYHNFIAQDIVVHNSIYGFRGADISNILNFQHDYPDAQICKLEINYRSTKTVVEAADSVVFHNKGRLDKKSYSLKDLGYPIELIKYLDEDDEALGVAIQAARLAREGVPYNKMAVLFRTNMQSKPIERALLEQNIPYTLIGGVSFYQRKEVKDLVAYLQLIANPADRQAFKRVAILQPGVGAKSVEKVLAVDIDGDLIATAAASPNKKIATLGQLLTDLRDLSVMAPPYEVLERIVKDTKYDDIISKDTTNARERIKNVKKLLELTKGYAMISEFLSQAALASVNDKDGPGVKLMTVHGAKGLEFEVVFLVGVEEGIFPHTNSLHDPRQIEEERRTMYVALTRAESRLFISWAQDRYFHRMNRSGELSRFIKEIPRQYIKASPDAWG